MDRAAARAAARDQRAGRRGATRGGPVALVLLAGAVAGGILVLPEGWGPADLLRPRAYVEVDGSPVAVPRPERAQRRPLPAVPVTTAGSYRFLHTAADGSPVGYDPCRPVHYVVRPDGAPASGPALLDDAIAVVSAASGLALVAAGTTDEAPGVERALIQPERYGQGWAPVLVAWSDPAELPELTGQVAGVGGSAAVPGADGSGQWLAGGRLVLDAPDITAMLAREGGYEQARAIIVHELAHVLGLDHVEDPGELMHPVTSHATELGPGDRQGLALVGAAACEE